MVGSSIGAVHWVFLLSFSIAAVIVKAKNKSKREETKRIKLMRRKHCKCPWWVYHRDPFHTNICRYIHIDIGYQASNNIYSTHISGKLITTKTVPNIMRWSDEQLRLDIRSELQYLLMSGI